MSCHFKRFAPKRKAVPGAARPAWPKEAAKRTPAQKQPPSPGQRLPHEAVFRERPRRPSSCQGAAPPSSALPRVAHAPGRPTVSLSPPQKKSPVPGNSLPRHDSFAVPALPSSGSPTGRLTSLRQNLPAKRTVSQAGEDTALQSCHLFPKEYGIGNAQTALPGNPRRAAFWKAPGRRHKKRRSRGNRLLPTICRR